MSSIKTTTLSINEVRANPANVRVHSRKQLKQLEASIKETGILVPIVIDEHNNVLAGHARLAAAKSLGRRSVPVMIVSGLSDAQRRAYVLADNKITENAGWDRAGLALELSELRPLLNAAGLDIDLTGFSPAEIDGLLADFVDPDQDPADSFSADHAPLVSQNGDLWLLDKHRVLCGDAKERRHHEKLLADDRANMVFADPPYNLRIAAVQGRGKRRHHDFVESSGELSISDFIAFLKSALTAAASHVKDGALIFVCIDWRHAGALLQATENIFKEPLNLVVWVKSSFGQGAFYRSQHELIFVFKQGGGAYLNNIERGKHGRSRTNVWTYPGVNSFRAGRLDDLAAHPTVKPVALVADAIRDCTRRGDIVFDPFLGSGTTLLAAERIGRRGYGLEIDPRYVDTAIRRWQQFTRKDAVLSATGQTFDEVTAERSAGGHRGR